VRSNRQSDDSRHQVNQYQRGGHEDDHMARRKPG
jgi:hypothetical protein